MRQFTFFQFWVFLYQYNAPDFGPVPRYAVVLICSSVFSILIFCTSDLDEAPVYWSLFPFIGFAMGMLWIYIQANEVLNILTALGKKYVTLGTKKIQKKHDHR